MVHIYRDGEAVDVEFISLDGSTAAAATGLLSKLRAVTNQDLTLARTAQFAV